jgi:2-oxoglutarate dehydrogenase E2 component (dihydrolipoamide succinyltransferase)
MIIEIKIPTPGESITEVEIASWLVSDGDIVEKDQEIAEIESDKATLMLSAEEGGQISIKAPESEPVKVGSIACTIDTDKAGETSSAPKKEEKAEDKEATSKNEEKATKVESNQSTKKPSSTSTEVKTTPVAEQMMDAHGVSVDDIIKGLSRLDKTAVAKGLEGLNQPEAQPIIPAERITERKKMSTLRRKISERLVQVKNETAMLTTFNEVDMSAVMELRSKYQKKFVDKHGIKLGFMSFFTKAAAVALKAFPEVNSMIDGNEIVSFNYADIGIAVQTPKGLMVPVIRDTEHKSLANLETEIAELANKARAGKISIDELQGGTFSITNGGIFGSMLSTPIINPPQAGILGMHNIVDRPVAIKGEVVIRPIMYLALSYDHRIIDGKSSVGFLKMIKELIEGPTMLLTDGFAEQRLLDI